MSINLSKISEETNKKIIDYLTFRGSNDIIKKIDSSITIVYVYDDILKTFSVTTIDYSEKIIVNNGSWQDESFQELEEGMLKSGIEEINIDTLKAFYNNYYHDYFVDGITTSFEEIERIMYFA